MRQACATQLSKIDKPRDIIYKNQIQNELLRTLRMKIDVLCVKYIKSIF